MKKPKVFIFITIGLLIVAGALAFTYIPKKIVKEDVSDVSKIEVFDGNTGGGITITSDEKIDHILSNLNNVTFQKGKSSRISSSIPVML